MEGDRKYRQSGYMDSSEPRDSQSSRDGKPKPKGPKPPIDVTGPRLPRLVESVTASRCYSCATTLPPVSISTAIAPSATPPCTAVNNAVGSSLLRASNAPSQSRNVSR